MDFVFGVWDGVKDNAELLLYKWNSAMKNHAKDGNRNKYAEELLIYVLCAYIVLGALVMLIVALIFFGVIKPFAQVDDLPAERIDLAPLLGDGLVQGLDGLVLIGDADFQRIDPGRERLGRRGLFFSHWLARFGLPR